MENLKWDLLGLALFVTVFYPLAFLIEKKVGL